MMRCAHIRELSSFTGWIFGLTSESKDNDKRIGSDTVTVSDGTREKIARLRYVNTLLTESWHRLAYQFSLKVRYRTPPSHGDGGA